MRVLVPAGTYRMVEERRIYLTAGPSGAGVLIGAVHKEVPFFVLASYLFPLKSQTLTVNDNYVLSGEELLESLHDDLKQKTPDLTKLNWVLAGGSKYKKGLEDFDLAEKNVSLAKNFLKKKMGVTNYFEFVLQPTYIILEVGGPNGEIKLWHNRGIVCL